jgi:hypothetical protein
MPVHPVHDLAAFLVGTWAIRREIEPGRGVEGGRFDGTATLAPDASGALRYEEHGIARIGGHVGTASRRLTYHVEGPRAWVRFVDGRLFHDLDLTSGAWEVAHPCAADLYRGTFTATGPDAWLQRWSVSGPTEAYELRTSLVRSPER